MTDAIPDPPSYPRIVREQLGSFATFLGAAGYALLSVFGLVFAWAAASGRIPTLAAPGIETALLVWASGACAGLAIHYAKR